MASEHLNDDRDVEQILKLAVHKAGYSDEEALRQRLMAAAGELGLTEAQVQAAEEEYRQQKELAEEQAEYHKYVSNEFWEHFWAYIIVNGAMVGFNFYQKGHIGWAIWPLIGWGIGIAFHAVTSFAKNTDSYQQEFEKWRNGRRRRRRNRERRATKAAEKSDALDSRTAAQAELDES